jgi:hypothetical protein
MNDRTAYSNLMLCFLAGGLAYFWAYEPVHGLELAANVGYRTSDSSP